MRISSAFNNITTPQNQKLNFTAGKTSLYSDFDGTFMLFTQDQCCKRYNLEQDSKLRNKFKSIYNEFTSFKEKNKKKFEFIITTGRNKGEFLYFIRKVFEQGLRVPLAEKLIVKNGGDIFKLSGKDYPYEAADIQKRKEIHKNSNWDARQVRKIIRQVLEEQKLLITHSPSNNHIYEYGDQSLEFKLRALKVSGKDAYASLRDDGALDMHIAIPQNVNGEKIADRIAALIAANNIKAKVTYNKQDNLDAIIPHYKKDYKHNYDYELNPGQSITVVPVIENSPFQRSGALCKLYDIRKSLKQIIDKDSNDLVIVAGNGENDKEMLDLLNYADLIGLPVPKDGEERLKFLADKKYVDKLCKLPLKAIIVGDDPKLDDVRTLSGTLNRNNAARIITVDGLDTTLLEGVKTAMSSYAKENEIFAKASALDLK